MLPGVLGRFLPNSRGFLGVDPNSPCKCHRMFFFIYHLCTKACSNSGEKGSRNTCMTIGIGHSKNHCRFQEAFASVVSALSQQHVTGEHWMHFRPTPVVVVALPQLAFSRWWCNECNSVLKMFSHSTESEFSHRLMSYLNICCCI